MIIFLSRIFEVSVVAADCFERDRDPRFPGPGQDRDQLFITAFNPKDLVLVCEGSQCFQRRGIITPQEMLGYFKYSEKINK